MPSAEMIAIGTELLLGEIQDSNTRYLAKVLRNINIDVYRSTIIGDNGNRISDLIKEALSRCDIVITSGGLGPTVDDPTRLAVANAVGVELVFLPELWTQIMDRFSRYDRIPSENNRRQAYIPKNSIPVENPVGTAPCYIYELDNKCIISLPGVPRELEYIFEHSILPYLVKRYRISGVIKVRVLHTTGLGESLVDEKVADFELLSNPTVGLLAHPGQTDIRITAKANSDLEADNMILRIEEQVRERLGDHIFGADDEKLETIVQDLLQSKNIKVTIFENGFFHTSQDLFLQHGFIPQKIEKYSFSSFDDFSLWADKDTQAEGTLCLGLNLTGHKDRSTLDIFTIYGHQKDEKHFSYGGPSENAPQWAVNNALNTLNRFLKS